MEPTPSTSLIDIYLERRAELLRFFTARMRSEAAAEDLVQEIYLRLRELGPQEVVHHPGSFIYRLGYNLMLDKVRSETRRGRRNAAWAELQPNVGPRGCLEQTDPDDALDARRRLDRILEAIGSLPPRTQEVFRLHKLQGLTHTEVAVRLGISRSSVEKHMITVLKLLARRTL